MSALPGLRFRHYSYLLFHITLHWPFFFYHAKRVREFSKRYCNNIDIRLVFSSFKIGNMFGMKDPIPRGLRRCVVYKFLWAGCNVCYVGETSQRLSTRVREHLVRDRTSHIFRHLNNSPQCRTLNSDECFSPLDYDSRTFQLKIKEATTFSGSNLHLIINPAC